MARARRPGSTHQCVTFGVAVSWPPTEMMVTTGLSSATVALFVITLLGRVAAAPLSAS